MREESVMVFLDLLVEMLGENRPDLGFSRRSRTLNERLDT
jgi:hypothetical protein